jgi:hypothetical protein
MPFCMFLLWMLSVDDYLQFRYDIMVLIFVLQMKILDLGSFLYSREGTSPDSTNCIIDIADV